MAAPSDTGVDLGFAEETDSWRLQSYIFPSKLGGKPAWLALNNLPSFDELKCLICGKQTVFLLQVYAPFDEIGLESCFHRTLFLFICKDPLCCQLNKNRNLLSFRSQLPRRNEFFSYFPPKEDRNEPDLEGPVASKYQTLCSVCGCPGPKKCSKCHKTYYCGKEHQALDWKAGHKTCCGTHDKATVDYYFKEYELLTESEEHVEPKDGKTEKQNLEEYKEIKKSQSSASKLVKGADVDKDLESMAKQETQEDKIFLEFKQRINKEPEQVLRYERGGQPLWISSEHIPKRKDIPNCACGAPRVFEFQVLPQLLTKLNVDSLKDSIDWGTLAVYTCRDSCDQGPAYKPEFVWKQDITR